MGPRLREDDNLGAITAKTPDRSMPNPPPHTVILAKARIQ